MGLNEFVKHQSTEIQEHLQPSLNLGKASLLLSCGVENDIF